MTAVALKPKIFSKSRVQGFLKVVAMIASRSDRLTEIYFSSNESYSFLGGDDNCE